MKPIEVGAHVVCTDGVAGAVKSLVYDPDQHLLTHLVVSVTGSSPKLDVVLPVDLVSESTAAEVHVDLTSEQLAVQEPLMVKRYIKTTISREVLGAQTGLAATYGTHVPELVEGEVDEANIPEGELLFDRGTEVMATDGKAGVISGFVLADHGSEITHIIVHHGHLWNKHDTTLPMSAVDGTLGDSINLNISRGEVEAAG